MLGRRFVRLVEAYAAGINGYYASNGIPSDPYTSNDVIAAAALIAARFGANGGQEAQNAMFLDALQRRLGAAQGRAVFDDLREANDPEAPVSVPGSFPYELPAASAPGSVVLDDGSFGGAPASRASRCRTRSSSAAAARRPAVRSSSRARRSATSSRSSSWRSPSRAAASPRAARSSVHYLYRGTCRAMTRFDAGILRASGQPDRQITFLETVHGPVKGYASVGGWRVAIALQRSTRGRELLSARAFYELDTNTVTSAQSFVRTTSSVEFSFNWFYADSRDIALFSSGRLPLRAPGTDSALPTVGTGEYDWRGFASAGAHAQAISPPSGAILNWNNNPAANVGSADSNLTYGSVQRVDLFTPLVAPAGSTRRRPSSA